MKKDIVKKGFEAIDISMQNILSNNILNSLLKFVIK